MWFSSAKCQGGVRKKALAVELPARVSRSRYAQLSRLLCKLYTISNLKVMHFIALVISFGYSGFIPAIHLIAEYSWTLPYRQAASGWVSHVPLIIFRRERTGSLRARVTRRWACPQASAVPSVTIKQRVPADILESKTLNKFLLYRLLKTLLSKNF